MNTTIEIQTRYNKDLIEQSILYPNDSLITQTTKQIIQLQDQAVKDALKKLGYLDPQEALTLLTCLNNLCRAYHKLSGRISHRDSELVNAQKLLEKYNK